MPQSDLSPRITARRRWQSMVTFSAVALLLFGNTWYTQASAAQHEARTADKVSREQADKFMEMSYLEFAALRRSDERPKGYRWDTDGCTPEWAPGYFTRACYLHDFGYRNYGSARKNAPHFSPTAQTKRWIDKRFYKEMYSICDNEAKTDEGRVTCKKKADRLYARAKEGRNAFFGPYGS